LKEELTDLIRIEEMRTETGDGLDIGGVQSKNLFVIRDGVIWIIESVIDPSDAEEEAWLNRELVSRDRMRRIG
jgi:hypothetical protein